MQNSSDKPNQVDYATPTTSDTVPVWNWLVAGFLWLPSLLLAIFFYISGRKFIDIYRDFKIELPQVTQLLLYLQSPQTAVTIATVVLLLPLVIGIYLQRTCKHKQDYFNKLLIILCLIVLIEFSVLIIAVIGFVEPFLNLMMGMTGGKK